ncbi:MAG: polysaccharide biosynthesis/export family protein [bacterium]
MRYKRFLYISLLVALTGVIGRAQVKEKKETTETTADQLKNYGIEAKADISDKVREYPLDHSINPEQYVVGPMDVFQLSVVGPIQVSWPLTVTPEGTLIIPMVGEFRVADAKLSEVKKKIVEKVKAKFLMGEVTLTLLRPRVLVIAAMSNDPMGRITLAPMESTIDPEEYIVGPSDLFHLGIWGPLQISNSYTVTPEGTLLIPSIGEISVLHQRLAEVKKKIIDTLRSKNMVGTISFTLLKPRSFVVKVYGAVLRPGQYIAAPIDRVEKLLYEASRLLPTPSSVVLPSETAVNPDPTQKGIIDLPITQSYQELSPNTSLRNILVIHQSGDTVRVDLPKYYATSQSKYNPCLKDGDIIFVPQRDLTWGCISIVGAVNAPGKYEFVEGDDLLDAIKIAKGFLRSADKAHILLSRLDDLGNIVEERVVNGEAIERGLEQTVTLKRGDRIFVQPLASQQGDYKIYLRGSIQTPGMYPIARHGTTLTKIIRVGGGFTKDALIPGIVILRKAQDLKGIVDPKLELLRAVRSSQLSIADSEYFNLSNKIGRYPVVNDFKKLFIENNAQFDVTLEDDDIIFIPSNTHTVLVHGQVSNPGYIPFLAGANLKYYITKAGGYSEWAIKGDTRVIKVGSLEWVDPENASIEPGDQIWVPKELIVERDFKYYFEIVRDVISIAASIASTFILAKIVK